MLLASARAPTLELTQEAALPELARVALRSAQVQQVQQAQQVQVQVQVQEVQAQQARVQQARVRQQLAARASWKR